MSFEEYKTLVLNKAIEELKKGRKFRGVCTDTILESFESNTSIEKAVATAVTDTLYWDGDLF